MLNSLLNQHWIRRFIMYAVTLFICHICFAQTFSITGPSCVMPGVPYTYSISGSVNYPWFEWAVSNGQIQGSSTGTSVTVIWYSCPPSDPNFPTTQCYRDIQVNAYQYVYQQCCDPDPNIGCFDCSYYELAETVYYSSRMPFANDPGAIVPGVQTYTYNQIPSVPLTSLIMFGPLDPVGDCNGYAVQWEIATTPDGPFNAIPGATGVSYTFSAPLTQTSYFRRKVSSASFPDAYSNVVKVEVTSPYFIENRNYVREHTVVVKGKTNFTQVDQLPIGKKFTSTVYFDGLGRPVQKVDREVVSTSSGTWNDVVTYKEYDIAGRTPKEFLPYSTSANPGLFKTDAATAQPNYYQTQFSENHAFARVDFEDNPLSRIKKSYAPGTNLGGANVGVETIYDLNNTNSVQENVRIWKINYAPGSIPYSGPSDFYGDAKLLKRTLIDAYGKKVIEYKDLSGNLILKKVQDKNEGAELDQQHAGWACTYYVYDDYNRVRYIITPKAVEWLRNNNWNLQGNTDIVNELCFWTEYDARGRAVRQKSAGQAFVRMIYDARDRLVFAQNGLQREEDKWVVTLYDSQDRPVLTGVIAYPGVSQELLQDQVYLMANFNVSSTAFSVTTDGSQNHSLQVSGNPLSNANDLFVLTITYYDNYNYPRVKTFNTNFTTDNTVPSDETETVAKSDLTKGAVTGSFVRVMDGTDKFLATTTFYNKDGKVIQTHTETYRNTTDITTVQFDYSGKTRSSHTRHTTNTTIGEITIFNRNIFDRNGRIIKITESINNATPKELAEYTYNEQGQLSKKRLAPGFNGVDGPQLETLNYKYNLRGNLLSINKDYVNSQFSSGNYFGIDLGYETAGNNFTTGRLDGNLTGVSWRSRGDNIQRRYEYQYDNRGQLTQATFRQKNLSGAGWTNDVADFSTTITYKDLNGNIGTMFQKGVVPGIGVQTVDNLSYFYDKSEWSNRLIRVDEIGAGSFNGKLGDFKDGSNGVSGGVPDYTYNTDGQLTKDINKEIGAGGSGIEYNILGLPAKVTFTNTAKTITYIYDATGNKVRKKVYQPQAGGQSLIDITTDYVDDFIYENGSLAFFSHTEGRVRIISAVSNGPNYLNGGVPLLNGKQAVYDYYIKDHLESIRMVLTEEQHQTNAVATMEMANDTQEQLIFGQPGTNNELAVTRKDNILNGVNVTGWTSNNSIKVSRLSTIGTDKKIGPNVFMRVMAGDIIYGQTDYYYAANATRPAGSTILNDIITSIIGSINGNKATGLIKSNVTPIQNNLGNPGGALGSFISPQGNSGTGLLPPKAYLTILFFDEQFNFISTNSSYVQVQTSGNSAPAINLQATAPRNGYAIAYISNESDQYVYFDNFQVTHNRGRIIEENHYYAYGLKISAITSKAISSNLGGAQANSRVTYGYQGSYSEEDVDALWNEFDLRTYDPQIGRWLSIDPYDEFASGYIGMGNNPANLVDPDGGLVDPTPLAKAFFFALKNGGHLTLSAKGAIGVSYFFKGEIIVKSFGNVANIASKVRYAQATLQVVANLNNLLQALSNINFTTASQPPKNFQQIDQVGFARPNTDEVFSSTIGKQAEYLSWDEPVEIDQAGNAVNNYITRQRFMRNYFTGQMHYTGPATGQATAIYPEAYLVPLPPIFRMLRFRGVMVVENAVVKTAEVQATESVIKGFTGHAANQAIERGFKTPDILKIVREGTPVQAMGRYGPQTRYALGGNTVVINAKGKVVTVFSNAPGTAKGLGKGFFIPFK